MPYIVKEDRKKFAPGIKKLNTPSNPGELNYLFTVIIDNYIKEKGLKYASVNDVVGAMECCKMELYRRIAAPYEDIKIEENGDVY